jgi:hypothetical protein
MKSNPSAGAFTDSKAADLRGLPVWEMEKWTRPKQQ